MQDLRYVWQLNGFLSTAFVQQLRTARLQLGPYYLGVCHAGCRMSEGNHRREDSGVVFGADCSTVRERAGQPGGRYGCLAMGVWPGMDVESVCERLGSDFKRKSMNHNVSKEVCRRQRVQAGHGSAQGR
jgi:hypothetical protein